jgi:preprotein translocase subunit SecY
MIKQELNYDKFKEEELSSSTKTSSKAKKLAKKTKKKKGSRFKNNIFAKSILELLSNKNILKKIGFTLLIVLIYRFLSSVPLPGIDMSVYERYFGQASASEASYLLLIFTGSTLDTPSIVGLGIVAYINASIIIQLLTPVIPKLTELSKDGAQGQQVINQYTRYLTVPLAFFYSIAYLLLMARRDLESTDGVTASASPVYLIPHAQGSDWPTATKILFMAMILTAGTMLLMWLSEAINEYGIGNGSSIIISTGILASLPSLISRDFALIDFGNIITEVLRGNFDVLTDSLFVSLIAIIIGAIVLITLVVFINESVRKIKVQHTRRATVTDASASSNLPIKLTITGVLPIIFASSVLAVPQLILPFIQNSIEDTTSKLYEFLDSVRNSFLFATTDNSVNSDDLIYSIVFFILIILFGVFYSYVVFKPKDTAENLQKQGAFVPGIRPGKSTENYIARILGRVAFSGSVFLAFLALLPTISRNLVQASTGINLAVLSGIGGTSILIVVSVIIDTVRQYNAMKASKSYEKYV